MDTAESLTDARGSDASLLAAAASGNMAPYAVIYERHIGAARRLAAQLRPPEQVDALVAEGFSNALAVIRSGAGPREAFRPFLLAEVHEAHVESMRVMHELVRPDDDRLDDQLAFLDPAAVGVEYGTALQAFDSLDERQQLALWHVEVERDAPATVAALLETTPKAVSLLARKARLDLRQAHRSLRGEVDLLDSDIGTALATAVLGSAGAAYLPRRRRSLVGWWAPLAAFIATFGAQVASAGASVGRVLGVPFRISVKAVGATAVGVIAAAAVATGAGIVGDGDPSPAESSAAGEISDGAAPLSPGSPTPITSPAGTPLPTLSASPAPDSLEVAGPAATLAATTAPVPTIGTTPTAASPQPTTTTTTTTAPTTAPPPPPSPTCFDALQCAIASTFQATYDLIY